jgi:hypothetical protein
LSVCLPFDTGAIFAHAQWLRCYGAIFAHELAFRI